MGKPLLIVDHALLVHRNPDLQPDELGLTYDNASMHAHSSSLVVALLHG
jgi:hypothetical protein